MKRLKHLVFLISLSSSLSVFSSCDLANYGGNNGKTLQKPNIFISEFYFGKSVNDCILEIGTLDDTPIDMSNLTLKVYNGPDIKLSYNFKNVKVSKSNLVLVENLESTFSDETSTIIKLNDNTLYGRYYIEIVDSKNNVIDFLGAKEFNTTFVDHQSLVKLPNHFYERDAFIKMNYVKVREGVTKYLGNLDSPLTEEELAEGPRLDAEEYGSLPFENADKSYGGYERATIRRLGDGDTSYFNWPSGSSLDPYTSVRYLMIDTPEIDHGDGGGEKYGDTAKEFNNEKLGKATLIYVQSCRGGALHESYGRYLGFVWYTTKANPTFDDLRLFNFDIVKAGLAKLSLYNKYEEMYYKDVLYYDYLDYANEYAIKNKLYIHEDK